MSAYVITIHALYYNFLFAHYLSSVKDTIDQPQIYFRIRRSYENSTL